jgi:hypothetical protein
MVVEKWNLTREQLLAEAYKTPQSDYAGDFLEEIRSQGYAVRNRGPVGVRGGKGRKRVFLNLFVLGGRQRNGMYAYKEVIDSEYPIRPNSRWVKALQGPQLARKPAAAKPVATARRAPRKTRN